MTHSISNRTLAHVRSTIEKARAAHARVKAKAEEKAGEVKQTLEVVGAAAGIAFIRGKMEDGSGAWNIPGTQIDMELAAGVAMIGAAYFDLFGKYDEDVLNAGNGIMAHYAGQVFRKFAKTGKLDLVAGAGFPEIVGGHHGAPSRMSLSEVLAAA